MFFCKRWVISREWKSEGVTDGKSGESMAEDEVTCAGRGVKRLVRGWLREAGSWFQRKGARSVVRIKSRKRMTHVDEREWPEERVLRGYWTEMRLWRGLVVVRTLKVSNRSSFMHVHREAEKRNQFSFVWIFYSTWQKLVIFFTYIRPKTCVDNFAATVTINILCLPVK